MKTKSGSFINSFIAMALVIAMICPYAYAADVGRATYVEGRVDVARQGFDFATPLREGDSVAIGDAIRTKSNSKAEVTFNDKSMVRLAQNTRIQVRDYVLDADNKRKTAEIMVDRGKTRTIIEKMPGLAEFNISTPNAKGTVHGSDVYTSFQAGSSSMLVAEGSLSVRNPAIPKEILTVPAGNSVMVQLDETPKGMRPYMEFEKKLQEQDTAIPVSTIRSRDATILKGAFTKISGDVRVTSKGSENSHKAMLSDVLGEGDTIETGAGGIAEISFENGNGMSLQENTRITIIKLIQDPKTKQYENRFEASMGKVRSRIEKLKETKSTFEIRTPTGVCGARGTLMYLQITPTGVKVFFEGGTGYLNSLISSVQSTVDAGQSAYADNSGNVSEPETLSGEERESWGSGWDTGNGTEGYSSEGGTVGIYLEGGDTGTIGGLEIVGSTDISIDDLFVDIPFPVEEETVPEEPVYDANFNLKGNIFHYCELVGTISGSQGGLIGSFWNEEQYAIFSSAGSFNLTDPAKEPFVWTINDDALQSGSSVTATGGAFYGLAGGIGGGDVDGGILEGLSMFIYIDPDGNVGIGGGKLIGLYSNADAAYFLLSTLEGLTGTILPGIYADPENIKPETSALSFVKNTNYSYDENINMNVEYLDGVTLGLDIPDQEFGWSIWGMKSCGTFSGTAPRTMSIFNLQIIGESSSRDGGDGDYWFGLGSGLRDTGSGKLSGAIRGMTLSGGKVGIFSGDLLGATIGCSSWEMVGLGQQETMGITGRNPKNADDFLSCIERGSFSAGGYGSFDNGSAINAVYMDAETFNFYDQDWGVWEASLGGTRDMETSDIFKIAIGGKHVSENVKYFSYSVYNASYSAYIIATLNGVMENDTLTGELTGKLKGIWLEADVDNMIRAGIISGAANGYIDVVEESGAWSAGAVGDWVEVTDLLTTEKLGFTMDQLNTFVSVPITEVYSNILAGSGSIAGGVAMTNTFKDFLNFAFNSWAANKWDASYTGSAGGNPITGQAGGTYNNGTFTGLGAGGTVVDGNITTMNTVTIDGNYAGSVDNPVLSDVTANVTVYAPAETPVT